MLSSVNVNIPVLWKCEFQQLTSSGTISAALSSLLDSVIRGWAVGVPRVLSALRIVLQGFCLLSLRFHSFPGCVSQFTESVFCLLRPTVGSLERIKCLQCESFRRPLGFPPLPSPFLIFSFFEPGSQISPDGLELSGVPVQHGNLSTHSS